MSIYRPAGFECIDPILQEVWDNPDDLPNLEELGIELGSHRNVYQRQVIDFSPQVDIRSVASPGFVACSGVVLKNNDTNRYTFGHVQPEVPSFEKHMNGRQVAHGEAVVLLGESSCPPDALWGLRDGKWGNITTRVISFESGSTWWAGVFDAMTGKIVIARRRPAPAMLHYQAFSPYADIA